MSALRRLSTVVRHLNHHNHHGHGPAHPGSDQGVSFIDKVKALGANALLGVFSTRDGYDQAFSKMEVTKVSQGYVAARLPVSKSLTNSYGTLHGGATATLVDILGTMALLTVDPTKPGVSVDINVTYVSAAKEGDVVLLEGSVLKHGKRMGFTQVTLKNEAGDRIIATGRHTKAFA